MHRNLIDNAVSISVLNHMPLEQESAGRESHSGEIQTEK